MARTVALNLLLKVLGEKDVKKAADALDILQTRIGGAGKRAGITSGLVAASGAATQLTAALAPVAGAIGALPGALAATTAATLTVKVAFTGMGEAMSAVAEGDAKKLEEAMKDLAPSAKAVVRESAGIVQTFKAIRAQTQQNMFAGVATPMRDVATNLAPAVKTGMSGVATEMNRAGIQALKFGSTPLARGTVSAVFKTTQNVIKQATGAVQPFLSGLAKVTQLSLPFAERLGLMAVNGAKTAGAFLNSKKGLDAFNTVVTTGVERLLTLGRIVKNLTTGLFNMFKQVRTDGGSLLVTVEGLTAKFAAWAKTSEGQQRVAETFKFLSDTMKKVVAILPLFLSPFVTLAKVITNLPEPFRSFASTALAVTVVFGPLVGKIIAFTKAVVAMGIAQKVSAAATKIWTAAVWLFNAALRANPIGIVITVLTVLVAAIILAYNKSETFRNIVQTAWRGIQAAVSYAWNSVLKPAFEAIKGWIVNELAPRFLWFHNNIVSPAFKAISFAVEVAWGIIKIIFEAIKFYITKVVAPVVSWLWKNIVEPAFKGIWFAIKVAWGIIKIIFEAIKFYISKVVAPVVQWLWNNIVKPVFDFIGKHIGNVWRTFIKPAFDAIKAAIKLVANSFQTAVTNIGKFWDKLKDAAKKPVKWVIDTVYTGGIKRVWDSIASKVGASPLPDAPRFAQGGKVRGPGGSKSDRVNALLSRGEYVVNASSTRKNLPMLEAINRKGGPDARAAKANSFMGDPGGILPGFAGGGLVEGLSKFFASAREFFAGGAVKAARFVTNPLLSIGDKLIGNTDFGRMIMMSVRKIIDGVLEWIKGKEPKLGGNGRKAVEAARSRIGTPYSWGGGGPGGPSYGSAQGANIRGFDCSSLMQYAWYKASGKVIPRTTYTQMPWVKRISSPVEGALGFPSSEHVFMYAGNRKIIEAPYTGARVREVPMRHAWWGMPPFATADDGTAVLHPGMNAIYNGTGAMEPLVHPSMAGSNITVQNLNLYFADDRDMYSKGKHFAEGLTAYTKRAGKGWAKNIGISS